VNPLPQEHQGPESINEP